MVRLRSSAVPLPYSDRPARALLAAALLEPCLLCGAPATIPALFVPYSEHDRVAYSLCEACLGALAGGWLA
jgi:hypothetical protein